MQVGHIGHRADLGWSADKVYRLYTKRCLAGSNERYERHGSFLPWILAASESPPPLPLVLTVPDCETLK